MKCHILPYVRGHYTTCRLEHSGFAQHGREQQDNAVYLQRIRKVCGKLRPLQKVQVNHVLVMLFCKIAHRGRFATLPAPLDNKGRFVRTLLPFQKLLLNFTP